MILIEEYCNTHKSAKSKRLERLVEASYVLGWEGTDSDAIFLEKAIEQEKKSRTERGFRGPG